MSRKIMVEIVGDSASLERSFQRSSHAATNFNRDIGRALRGALAGTGAFHSLGRSIAFASGGFLAFASAGDFLRKSIDAARDAAVTHRQLATQMRANGESFAAWRGQIDKSTLALSHLSGFEDDELLRSLTNLERATGDSSQALRLNAVAADVARGRHISLMQASIALSKAATGNTTALKRLGIEIPKTAKGMDALRYVAQKFEGQAKSGATATDRFGAELHNSEEIIGGALLPTLNKYLAKGADWLDQMNRSGKLQRDVRTAVDLLTQSISAAKDVLTPFVQAFRTLGRVVGGTKNEIKLLAAAFLVLKANAAAVRLTETIGQIRTTGTVAKTSAGLVAMFRKSLLGLNGLVVKYAIVQQIIKRGIPGQRDLGLDFSNATASDQTVTVGGKVFIKGSIGELEARETISAEKRLGLPSGLNLFGLGSAGINIPGNARGSATSPFTLSPAQQRAINLAGDPSLGALRAQAAFDRAQLAVLERRRAAGKVGAKSYTAAVIAYKNDLAQQENQIEAILQRQREAEQRATEKRKAAAKAAAAAAKKQIEDLAADVISGASVSFASFRQFQRHQDSVRKEFVRGLAKKPGFVVPLSLQLAAARAGSTVTDADDLAAARQIKAAAMKALHSGKLAIQAQIDAWNVITQANQTLGQQQDDALRSYHAVSTRALTAGLHLSRMQRLNLESRLAQAEAHGGMAPSGVGVLGQVVINVHGDPNPDVTARKVLDKLQKHASHGRAQTRGRSAGRNLGLH